MANLPALQTNFTAGEWSPKLRGRVDVAGYYNAAKTVLNCIPFVHGGVTRRPGTRHVAEVKFSSKKTRIIPFKFSTTQNYVLEFGDFYMRIYRAHGQGVESAKNITGITKANPAVVTVNSHGYINGKQVYIENVGGMTQLNGGRYTVAGVTANTFELQGIDSTGYGTYTSGGTSELIYELSTPYGENDLEKIKFTQSADVLYVVHPDYAPRQISRTADLTWTITQYDFLDGPYLDQDTSGVNITPSATTGSSVTLTASADFFAPTDIGRLIRFGGSSPTWGWAKITGYTSPTVATCTVKSTLPNGGGAISIIRKGAWSDTTGWPSTIAFFQERLMFAGTKAQPQTVWGSKNADFVNHAPTDMAGTVSDDNGVTFTIADDQVNAIRWLAAGKSLLLIGSSDGEHLMYGGNAAGALVPVTPSNIAISREGTHGSATYVRIHSVGNGGLVFVQPSKRRVRHMKFNAAINSYDARDITLRSEHITQSGIVDFDYQEEIDSKMWFVRADGVLVGATFDENEEVNAWHRHILGGVFDNGDAICESVSVIPNPDETEGEDVWLIVKRTINGATKRYIEYITEDFNPDEKSQSSGIFVDSSLTYDGFDFSGTMTPGAMSGTGITFTASSSTFSASMIGREIHYWDGSELKGKAVITGYTDVFNVVCTILVAFPNTNAIPSGKWAIAASTISGLSHLEGQQVQINGDGSEQAAKTVSNGSITLDDQFAKIHVGLGYKTRLELFPVEFQQLGGTVQANINRTYRADIYFYQTMGARFGRDFDNSAKMEQILWRRAADSMDLAPPLFTGFKKLPFPAGHEAEQSVCIEQITPCPMTVLMVKREVMVNA